MANKIIRWVLTLILAAAFLYLLQFFWIDAIPIKSWMDAAILGISLLVAVVVAYGFTSILKKKK